MLYPWLEPAFSRFLAQKATLAHAVLLTGAPGIGKHDFAMAIAAAQLCETPGERGEACNTCLACGWFRERNHPDFRAVVPIEDETAEKSTKSTRTQRAIRIDQIRELADFLSIGAHRGGPRVILIEPADAMNPLAANALLKSLEEPGAGVLWMLVTARPEALPITIRSRCVNMALPGPGAAEATAWLRQDTGASASEAAVALAATGRSPLLARQLIEPEQAAAHRMLMETIAALPDTGFAQADILANQPASRWLVLLQAWVTDLGRAVAGSQPAWFQDRHQRLGQLGSRTSLSQVTALAHWLDDRRRMVDHPLNARLFCEEVLIRYAAAFQKV